MKSFLVTLALSLGLLPLGKGQETEPQTIRVPASRDAVLFGEDVIDGVNRANGKGDSVSVGAVQAGILRRTVLDFNLDGYVPPGAVILDAKLQLTPISALTVPVLFIFRLNNGWAGGTTDPENEIFGDLAQDGDVTWLFRNYNLVDVGRTPWQTQPGGDFNPEQPLLSDIGTVIADGDSGNSSTLSYTSEPLVADVQRKLDRPGQHNGWILLGDESSFTINVAQFASRENEDESTRPTLEITFTAPTDVDKVVTNYDALTTVAGLGEDGGRGNHWRDNYEGGLAIDAELSRPSTAVAAEDGTIYFTDTYGHAIRKINPDGIIETVAGAGIEGYNLDEGPALEVQLDQPNGLAVLPSGNLYILDIDNKRVRKVTPDGTMTTVFHDLTEPEFLTGRGLWVSPDESTIVFGSRTAIKRWSASTGNIEVLAEGFDRVANLDKDAVTGDFIAADIDDNTVWRIPAEGGGRQRIAGGGRSRISGIDPRDADLEGVRGLAVSEHGGYFLATEESGDFWYIDTAGLAHVLLRGSGNSNTIGGEGQILRDLLSVEDAIQGQAYSITIAPNGDLILVSNETGVIRMIPKGRSPLISQISRGDASTSLTWSSQVQRLYLVEGTEDLENWTVLSEVPSNQNQVTYTDADLLTRRFYRVRFFYP